MNIQAIGTIHTPFTDLENMPIQPAGAIGVQGQVEVFEEYRAGLKDLDGFSHVILLYAFHRSDGFSLEVVPFMDTVPRGLFATRAPRRPNPIGLSVVQLDGLESGVLHVRNIDVLDGTPLLDIKPFFPAFDHPENVRTGWLENAGEKVRETRSDGRFVGGGAADSPCMVHQLHRGRGGTLSSSCGPCTAKSCAPIHGPLACC